MVLWSFLLMPHLLLPSKEEQGNIYLLARQRRHFSTNDKYFKQRHTFLRATTYTTIHDSNE
ncbi:MAG: hypothetical protein PUK67_01260 [Prevotellaceae bacterium]|nr:hypothetical protein [Prevotellaceae bacterium]MDY3364963.1 hypothetical protein [Prevotella sp.]